MVQNETSSPCTVCRLTLDAPPHVAFAAVGVHGRQAPRDSYVLPDLWAIHLYLRPARFTLLGHDYQIQPGDVSLTPRGRRSVYQWQGTCELLCAHFRVSKHAAGPGRWMPVVTSVSDDLGRWRDRMEAIIAARCSPKANAVLWTLLWELHDRAVRGDASVDPALERATQWIELHLNKSFRISELARAVGVSHTYLGRLFRIHHHTSIIGYVRTRRAERARHLLEHTTQPAKAIASLVAMPDLQRLNKLLRRAYGHGPRWFR